jgi:hypothetical protein
MKEVTAITLVCFVAAFVITTTTGCSKIIGQGVEFRIGLANYNEANDERGYKEPMEMEVN